MVQDRRTASQFPAALQRRAGPEPARHPPTGPTKEVWYFEQPLPEGRKKYSKTLPIQFDDFHDCLAWWNSRKEGTQSWKVSAEDLLGAGCNLDLKNPHAKQDLIHLHPKQLATDFLDRESQVLTVLTKIREQADQLLCAANVESRTAVQTYNNAAWSKMKFPPGKYESRAATPTQQFDSVPAVTVRMWVRP